MAEFDLSPLLYGLFIGLTAGALAGSIAGLSGLGGGLIYVPLFYASMPETGQSGMALPIFASMVAIIITGFFSARSHWRLGHVDQNALQQLLPGLAIGAGLGLWSTLRLPETSVLLGLAALNAWIAYDYGRRIEQPIRRPSLHLPIISGPIGFVSGLFGIGGGTMLVPLLRRLLPLRFAVGTAAMSGLAIAIAAVLLNLVLESGWWGLLARQWLLLAGIGAGLLLALPASTRWSARLHDNIDEPALQVWLKGLFVLLSAGLFIAAVVSLG